MIHQCFLIPLALAMICGPRPTPAPAAPVWAADQHTAVDPLATLEACAPGNVGQAWKLSAKGWGANDTLTNTGLAPSVCGCFFNCTIFAAAVRQWMSSVYAHVHARADVHAAQLVALLEQLA
jgi:hypothetical protein